MILVERAEEVIGVLRTDKDIMCLNEKQKMIDVSISMEGIVKEGRKECFWSSITDLSIGLDVDPVNSDTMRQYLLQIRT